MTKQATEDRQPVAWTCPRCGEVRRDSDCWSCLIDLYLQEQEADMEVIGQPEIAKRYGVSLATVWQWRRRYPEFPPPIPGRVAGAPAFDAAKVAAWYAAKWPGRVASERDA